MTPVMFMLVQDNGSLQPFGRQYMPTVPRVGEYITPRSQPCCEVTEVHYFIQGPNAVETRVYLKGI